MSTGFVLFFFGKLSFSFLMNGFVLFTWVRLLKRTSQTQCLTTLCRFPGFRVVLSSIPVRGFGPYSLLMDIQYSPCQNPPNPILWADTQTHLISVELDACDPHHTSINFLLLARLYFFTRFR